MRDLDAAVRKKTKTKSCGCQFVIKTVMFPDSSGWEIKVGKDKNRKHNHGFIVYPEGDRQACGVSANAKDLICDMSTAQAKPCSIFAAVKEKNPPENLTINHIYNHRDWLGRHAADGMDIVHQFLHLAPEAKYLHWIRANSETEVLTHAFMAHPTSVNLLRTFHWVIGMGSTYKTNKYKMPFFEMDRVTSNNMNFLIGYAFMRDVTEFSYGWVLDKLKILIGQDVIQR